ncbi:MAG: DUF433 domain-containing protein [Burkholderiales bacterium]|nr:DUF433 domain-containing protein [Burkholderiales bacterium]
MSELTWPERKVRHERKMVSAMEIFPGISVDPGVRFGRPCLAGTRLDVATIIDALGAGESYEDVERDYQLTREQVLTALRYAAHVAAHQPPAVKAA